MAGPGRLQVAEFTVRATAEQSARWKQASGADGLRSVGAWLAGAADAFLRLRARAGLPLPLAWHQGRFLVALDGLDLEVRGMVSPPFGYYQGDATGPNRNL